LEYQPFRLFVGEVEHEISGESALIALHRLIEIARRYTIEPRQVRIEHDFLAADEEDELRDVFRFQDDCHAPWGN
jgi:hypothetical protein